MSSWSGSVKSKGILAFANNTDSVDYVSIAQKSLRLAEHHLGIPSMIVSNDKPADWNNARVDTDSKQTVTWNNHGRYQAYQASPWDETLVIDVDYLVTTDRLKWVFDQPKDLLLCHNNNIIGKEQFSGIEIQPVWATVFFFRRSDTTCMFFDLVGRIQRNWNYYRSVYSCPDRKFRNDYAFAIAELILNGHASHDRFSMRHGITTIDETVDNIDINDEWMVVRCQDRAHVLPRCDLHVMSKTWLQSTAFDQFVQKASQ